MVTWINRVLHKNRLTYPHKNIFWRICQSSVCRWVSFPVEAKCHYFRQVHPLKKNFGLTLWPGIFWFHRDLLSISLVHQHLERKVIFTYCYFKVEAKSHRCAFFIAIVVNSKFIERLATLPQGTCYFFKYSKHSKLYFYSLKKCIKLVKNVLIRKGMSLSCMKQLQCCWSFL